ncbi:hypothetical protein CRG98_016737 [Punica granatum]|uniref:Uncharacterized protein n=1 Tax=Punica granatum TaxID=22663 RepID=A0A2I0K432_PUNGR|nr:hypothetical protein CRG98_016737 [Punica granatum]
MERTIRGLRLAAPNPESTEDLRLVPGRFRVQGHQSETPTPPPRSSASSVGADDLGGGIGVANWRPKPQIDQGQVGGPRSIWDSARQSATPIPPPRSPAPTEDARDLGGGVGVVGWRLEPRIDRGHQTCPRSIRGRQSVTSTPPQRPSASSVGANDLGGGVGVAD